MMVVNETGKSRGDRFVIARLARATGEWEGAAATSFALLLNEEPSL